MGEGLSFRGEEDELSVDFFKFLVSLRDGETMVKKEG